MAVDLAGELCPPEGGIIYLSQKDFYPLDTYRLWTGQYEKPELTILWDHFVPDGTIIENGANIGVVSRAELADKTSNTGNLICIEENPAPLPCLARNIGESVNSKPITILPYAIGAPNVEGAEILILKQEPKSLDRCSQILIERHPPSQAGMNVAAGRDGQTNRKSWL